MAYLRATRRFDIHHDGEYSEGSLLDESLEDIPTPVLQALADHLSGSTLGNFVRGEQYDQQLRRELLRVISER